MNTIICVYKVLLRRIVIVFVALSAKSASAQVVGDSTMECSSHFCCCNEDPSPVGSMLSHAHDKGEWMISYRYMNMGMDGILTGMEKTEKSNVFTHYIMAPDYMRMDMHMLMAMYGVSDKLTGMVMLNYNATKMSMSMYSAGMHHHSSLSSVGANHVVKTSGMGDTRVYALYAFLKSMNRQLVLSAGISIPTGSTTIKGSPLDIMYGTQRLPYAMQMGSGTIDVLSALSYLYKKERIAVCSQLSSMVHGGCNRIGYALGDEINVSNWIAYKWNGSFSSSVRVEGIATGRIKGYDPTLYYFNEPSANPVNYGGKRIICSLGSAIQFRKGFVKNNRLGIEYGMPLYQDLNGVQMASVYFLNASWIFSFK